MTNCIQLRLEGSFAEPSLIPNLKIAQNKELGTAEPENVAGINKPSGGPLIFSFPFHH